MLLIITRSTDIITVTMIFSAGIIGNSRGYLEQYYQLFIYRYPSSVQMVTYFNTIEGRYDDILILTNGKMRVLSE